MIRDWFFSLQFRLIIGFTAVLALTLGGVGVYVAFAAQRQVKDYDGRIENTRNTRLERLLSRAYSGQLRGEGLQRTLEHAGLLFDRRIVVTDDAGKVIGDSSRRFGRPLKGVPPGSRLLALRIDDRRIGSVVVAPNDSPEGIPDPPVSQFASALNRSLIWTGLAAGVAGILVVSLVSQRILVPVRALSAAASRLEGGDLSQRVSASGPSEISRLAQTFNGMAENLQKAEQQRRNLVADVAHELRTPVSNIQGYLEATEDGLLEPDRAISTIQQQVSQLSAVIEDLRLLSMAEAGHLRLDLEPCDVEELLVGTVEAIRPRAQAKGVSLSLQVLGTLPEVSIDRRRITQAMDNLLDNAMVHTPEGGSVTVSAASDWSRVTITVADTGEGIPVDLLPFVFERLYRVDPSRTRATGGTGLGLTIARQLIEAHRGTIRVESRSGEGSRFIFHLPLT